jgi:hypothetical protein
MPSAGAATTPGPADVQYSWSFHYDSVLGLGGQSGTQSGSYDFQSLAPWFPAGSVTAVGRVAPTVQAYSFVSSVEDSPIYSDIQGQIVYEGEVVGPAGPVFLDVSALLRARAQAPDNSATASWSVSQGGSGLAGDSITYLFDPNRPGKLAVDSTAVEVQADMPFQVTLFAGAYGDTSLKAADCCDFGDAHALADPVFKVDPSNTNANAYSLVFSPGIGNGAPAPEPAAWALMLVGVGGLGGAARASRRKASRPA